MGAAWCVESARGIQVTDWIAIISLVVNAILAVWIVRTIQDKLANRRVLKDHFISEIKEIRNEYKLCLNNLYLDQSIATRVIPWFKLMNIKVDDLMNLISEKYKIDKRKLNPYQNDLRELITENEDYIGQYKSGKPIIFSEPSKNKFIKFQQLHNHLFNDTIVEINDSVL